MLKQLKVYGTVAGEKRIIRKGHYYSATRDRRGRFKSFRTWSPKRPNKPKEYVEKYTEKGTGKQVYEEVKQLIGEETWVKYEVRSP